MQVVGNDIICFGANRSCSLYHHNDVLERAEGMLHLDADVNEGIKPTIGTSLEHHLNTL